ncbi:MAG: hypothetical protein IJ214_01035, partial [Clostridia bacterium]|nr:hypothetical protein [Clostridia bacterium]
MAGNTCFLPGEESYKEAGWRTGPGCKNKQFAPSAFMVANAGFVAQLSFPKKAHSIRGHELALLARAQIQHRHGLAAFARHVGGQLAVPL